jgi:hypothetical protein
MKPASFLYSLALGLAIAGSITAYAPSASACACCSDPGQRVESTGKLEAYQKGELERIRFAKTSKLFMDASGLAPGVADPQDLYELSVSRAADKWTFSFKDKKGKTGTLAFTLPATLETFMVDPQDGKPGDPVLYKEWRVSAPVAVTGIFSGAGTPTAKLVLQGRGNSCTDADQFKSYMLVVSGPSANFKFFGTLTTPAPSTSP